MKSSDLSGAQRQLFESFRQGGMSEEGALIATLGRNGTTTGPRSGFDAMTGAFVGLGLTEEAARLAVIGRNGTESSVREAHAVGDRQREDAAVVSTVRDIATRICREDVAVTQEQAVVRACGQVRESFVGSEHAARVDALLRTQFPPPVVTSRSTGPSRASIEARLREARRRGTPLRVIGQNRQPTGEILSLAEIDRLLGGNA